MTQRTFYPGDKWVYFKIYCPPTMTNYILTERIGSLVNRWYDEGIIEKWFYIRYSDTGYHIRLRVELICLNHISKVVIELRNQLSEELGNGTVSSIQLDTYQRELERYGASYMELCESFFFKDSCSVLETIKEKTEDIDLICHSILWLLGLLISIEMTDNNITDYLLGMEDRYQREFRLSTFQIKVINDEYRKIRGNLIGEALELYGKPRLKVNHIDWITAPDSSQYLLSSLVHMHVNRVFPKNQRLYEYIIYHITNKVFDSILKISASSQV